MKLLAKMRGLAVRKAEPAHLTRGKLGEQAAKRYLQRHGMTFLTANFRSQRGEIDLIFRVADSPTSSPAGKDRVWKFLAQVGARLAEFVTPGSQSKRRGRDLEQWAVKCLVFVEVKTRSSEEWGRPASAVDAERRGRLTRAALDYLARIRNPAVKVRFDIVEVLVAGSTVNEIRHLPNAFPMERPHRYG